jgi:hypothetical protein
VFAVTETAVVITAVETAPAKQVMRWISNKLKPHPSPMATPSPKGKAYNVILNVVKDLAGVRDKVHVMRFVTKCFALHLVLPVTKEDSSARNWSSKLEQKIK